MNQID